MITYYGAHDSMGRFHLTDERDCLPPDAKYVVRYEARSAESALDAVKSRVGAPVTFQVGDLFYETDGIEDASHAPRADCLCTDCTLAS